MATGADTLRRFVYGDVPMDEWSPRSEDGESGEPWASFVRARQLSEVGQVDEATQIWKRIALDDKVESRPRLQAWDFLRRAGQSPPAEYAKHVLGTVIEMPVRTGHDLLAAYEDGSARYLNYSGTALVWEVKGDAEVDAAISTWIGVGSALAERIGPWEESGFPALPPGHLRIMMLTPSGPHFGQGPQAALLADEWAGAFANTATQLLVLLLARDKSAGVGGP